MNGNGNHGVIIRQLRLMSKMSVRKCSSIIGRSTGWLSEIENGRGTARIREREFDRIVEALDGAKHRDMFCTWVATHKKHENADRTFDGAVLKFIRIKKRLRLKDAAIVTGFSASALSKIERGVSPVTADLRNKVMVGYGYSPASFKNLNTDPVRSKAVPLVFKLEILLRQMTEGQIKELFDFATSSLRDVFSDER